MFLFTSFAIGQERYDFWSPIPDSQLVLKLLDQMTPEELVGQVLLLGYPTDYLSTSYKNWISKQHLGGLKIFGWNSGNLGILTRTIREAQALSQKTLNKIPLFIATDQEGGWVRHIRSQMASSPGNLAIGASGLPWDAFQTGYYLGLELRELGVNMNFAPTVDIYTNHNANVIGPRAFSDDPVTTAILAVAFYKGLDKTRVIATAKHFPGHGNSDEDSHGILPKVSGSLDDLRKRELLPYNFLIRENIPSIMTGHLAFPEITGKVEPASLSTFFATTLLKKEMGFQNLVITDDLFMEGARYAGESMGVVCERALMAGNDLLMISQTEAMQMEVYQYFLKQYKNNAVFQTRLKQAVTRNIMIKLRFLKKDNRVTLSPSSDGLALRLPNPAGQAFFLGQAARAVTVIHNKRIPFDNPQESILLVTPYPSLYSQFQSRFSSTRALYYEYDPFFGFSKAIRDQLIQLAPLYKKVVFNLVTPGSLSLLEALYPFRDKLTVVSFLTPIYLRETPWVQSSIAVYGTGTQSQQAAVGAIIGDFVPSGRLPITLD